MIKIVITHPLELYLPAVMRPEPVFSVFALVLVAGSGRRVNCFLAGVGSIVIHGFLKRKLVDVKTSLGLEHLSDHAPMA